MRKDRILDARREAEQFIARCDVVLGELASPDFAGSDYHYGSRASGALRRQSMELTVALALMRRSQ